MQMTITYHFNGNPDFMIVSFMIRLVLNAVEAVPSGKGLGVIYWEPAACSKVLPDNYPLGACRIVAENTLQFTDAMKGFGE